MSTIRIAVTADICPNNGLEDELLTGDPKRFIQPHLELFERADLVIGNLETPLTTNATPILKTGPNFITKPEVLGALRDMGFDCLTLCNNHTNDQGLSGMKDTLAALDAAEFPHCGAGLTHEEACAPAVFEIKGRSIAVFNFGEGEFSQAQDEGPGAARLDAFWAEERIWEARADFDHILVILHVGNEYAPIPSTVTTDFCRRFAAAGADAVIAHHAHIPQCTEVVSGVPICFSLGNFLFGYPRTPEKWAANPCWFLSTVAEIEIDDDGANLILHPSIQNEDLAHQELSNAGRLAYDEYMKRCESIMATDESHRRVWDQEARDLFKGLRRSSQKWVEDMNGEDEDKAYRAGLCLYNVFRCDAHRAVMQHGLRMMYEKRLDDDFEAQAELATLRQLIMDSFA